MAPCSGTEWTHNLTASRNRNDSFAVGFVTCPRRVGRFSHCVSPIGVASVVVAR
jgi:hypothetical protein